MLSINAQTVPADELLYIAFRLAFLDTMERMSLAQQLDVSDRCFGYLTQVPFLRNVHPGVQLEQLLYTWNRHAAAGLHRASLCDEAIIYSACETAALVVRTDRLTARRILQQGPRSCVVPCDSALADRLQQFHLQYVAQGHFLLLSQFLDLPPQEANRLKQEFGVEATEIDYLFDLLGRYRVSPLLAEWARGLLTTVELRNLLGQLRVSKSRWATT